MPSDLNWTERLLYRLITAPSGVAEGLAQEKSLAPKGLADVIAGDDRLSAEERVDIYANMYFYRILDVLKEDFPATFATIGDAGFHNLVTGYLVEYPPEHFSISYAGARLADFIENHPVSEEFPHLADLARMERALIEVFHAPDATPLDVESMRETPASEWPALKLARHPATEILNLEWNVASILQALDRSEELPSPARERTCVLIWRARSRVFYRAIDPSERDELDAFTRGCTFAELCELIGNVEAINQRLQAWLGDGMLIRK
jgi:hypothetical protein